MLAQNIAVLVIVYAARLLVPLLVIPILARNIAANEFGVYMYAISFAAWLAIFVEYGFSISSNRAISSARSSRRIRQVVIGTESAKVLLAIATLPLVLASLLVLLPFQAFPHWAMVGWTLGILQAITPMYYFQGRERLRVVGLVELGSGLLTLVMVWTLVKDTSGFYVLPFLLLIPRAIATVLLWNVMRRQLKSDGGVGWSMKHGCAFLKSGFQFFIFQAAVSLYTTFNVVLLGFFVSPSQVGPYATAEKLIRAGLGFLAQFSAAIFPRLNALKIKDRPRMLKMRKMALVGMVGIGCIGAALTWFMAPIIAPILLKNQTNEFISILRVLAVIFPAIAVSNVLGFLYLIVDHREKYINALIVAAAITNLVAAYFLVSRFGTHGMAYSWVSIEWLIALSTVALAYRFRSSTKGKA